MNFAIKINPRRSPGLAALHLAFGYNLSEMFKCAAISYEKKEVFRIPLPERRVYQHKTMRTLISLNPRKQTDKAVIDIISNSGMPKNTFATIVLEEALIDWNPIIMRDHGFYDALTGENGSMSFIWSDIGDEILPYYNKEKKVHPKAISVSEVSRFPGQSPITRTEPQPQKDIQPQETPIPEKKETYNEPVAVPQPQPKTETLPKPQEEPQSRAENQTDPELIEKAKEAIDKEKKAKEENDILAEFFENMKKSGCIKGGGGSS